MSKGLVALWYKGGKSDNGGRTTGRWIASKLPQETNVSYIEPFAGMLGVLLQRPKCNVEIANDLNGRVVNWWRMVQDERSGLEHALKHTPWSERRYNEAWAQLDDDDPLTRAVAFSVVVMCGQQHGDDDIGTGFVVHAYTKKRGGANGLTKVGRRIERLRERVENVQLYERPAIDILRKMEPLESAVIYCDPPYRTANTHAYAVVQHDIEEMVESLKAQRGRVAISGYGDEWDMLGWQRQEYPVRINILGGVSSMQVGWRQEVLWTNYEPPQARLI